MAVKIKPNGFMKPYVRISDMSNKRNRGNKRHTSKQTIPDDIRRGTSYQQAQKESEVSEASQTEIKQSKTEVVVEDPPQMTKIHSADQNEKASNDAPKQTNYEGDSDMSEENKNPETQEAKVETVALVLFRVKHNGDRVQRAELEVPIEIGSHSLSRMPSTDKENDSATLASGLRFIITEEDMESGDCIAKAIERFNRKYRKNPVVGNYHIEVNVDVDKAA